MTDFLDTVTDLAREVSWERASTDTSGVGLHNTDGSLDGLRRNTKASANTTDGCVAGGNVGVCAEVHVEHSGVSSLSNDLL